MNEFHLCNVTTNFLMLQFEFVKHFFIDYFRFQNFQRSSMNSFLKSFKKFLNENSWKKSFVDFLIVFKNFNNLKLNDFKDFHHHMSFTTMINLIKKYVNIVKTIMKNKIMIIIFFEFQQIINEIKDLFFLCMIRKFDDFEMFERRMIYLFLSNVKWMFFSTFVDFKKNILSHQKFVALLKKIT